MPILPQRVPSPVGKVKAVVPALVMGPSTKLEAEVPDVDEPAAMFTMFVEVDRMYPRVSVKAPLTVIALFNVMSASDKVAVVLLTVRSLNVMAFAPEMF